MSHNLSAMRPRPKYNALVGKRRNEDFITVYDPDNSMKNFYNILNDGGELTKEDKNDINKIMLNIENDIERGVLMNSQIPTEYIKYLELFIKHDI